MTGEAGVDLSFLKKLEISVRAIQFEKLQRFKPVGLAYRNWKGISGGAIVGYERVWMPEWEYQGKQGKGKITRHQYGLRRSDESGDLNVSADYQWSPDNNPNAEVRIEEGSNSLEIRWKGFNDSSIEKKEEVDVVLDIGDEHWWVVQTAGEIKVHTGKENELCPADNNQNNLREINRLIAGMANFRLCPDLQTTRDSMVGVAHAVLTKTRPVTKLPVG